MPRRASSPSHSPTAASAAPSVAVIGETVRGYIDRVLSGGEVVGRLVRLCVQRHVNDLEHAHERGLYFDSDAGARVVRFFWLLKHSKGEWAGQPFILSPWQMFLLYVLFGWKREEDDTRRFRSAYCEICRKNGKTSLAAGVGLYMLVADDEAGAEVYTAATKRDQARIAHSEAVRMVRSSPGLKRMVGVSKDNLYVDATNGRYVALGGDADSTDGLSPSCCIIDELHAHKGRGMFDVLDTATGARRQPLLFCITTAGHDRTSLCFEQHDYAQRVLEGVVEDDTFFAFVASIDVGDDWRDESVWPKANPNLNISLKVDDLRRKAQRAKEMPTSLNSFLRLHLGVWTEAESRWLELEKWVACGKDRVDPDELAGRACFAGLDLSSTTDLSALVLVFPDEEEEGSYDVLPFFWVPRNQAALRERRDGVPYLSWMQQGLVEASEGDVVDYELIRRRLNELSERYQIRGIAADPWNATHLVTQLQGDGLEVVMFRQGYASMSAPSKELEKLVVGTKLRHGNHPVLNWMAANVVVEQDAAGNLKPSKAKSSERIDGVVALVMALGVAAVAEPEGELVFAVI